MDEGLLPFAGMHRTPIRPGSDIFNIPTNGGNVLLDILDNEYNYKLPSDGAIVVSRLKSADGKLESEETKLSLPKGKYPIYYYKYENDHSSFAAIDGPGQPRRESTKQEFSTGMNVIMGPYDPVYVTDLTNKFNERDNKSKQSASTDNKGVRETHLRITADGKATIVEEINPGLTAKLTKAFIDKEKQPLPLASGINSKQRHVVLSGNDWSPDLQKRLQKLMPDDEIQAIKKLLEKGKVTFELDEVKGDPVCRAIAGKPKVGSPDLCSSTTQR